MIVAGRRYGLGAGLANIMNAIRVSRKYDLELRILRARLPLGHHYLVRIYDGTELIAIVKEMWKQRRRADFVLAREARLREPHFQGSVL